MCVHQLQRLPPSEFENEMDELDDIQNYIKISNRVTNVINDVTNPLYNISIGHIQGEELSGDYPNCCNW